MSLILAIDWIRWAPAIGTFVGGGLGLAAFLRQIQTQRQEAINTRVAREAKDEADKTNVAIEAMERALKRLEEENVRLSRLSHEQHLQIARQQTQIQKLDLRVEKCDLEKTRLLNRVEDLLAALGRHGETP